MKKYIHIIALLVIGAAYIFSLAPCITATGDSSEMVVASFTLGVAHEPGYPLYTLLGKVFTYLPISNVACRVNAMSVFFALLSLFFLYKILEKLLESKAARLLGLLTLAFVPIIWEYSVVAEVFSLNNFFIYLTIYMFLLFRQKKDLKTFLLMFLCIGLGASHHHTIIILGPGMFVILLYMSKYYKQFGMPDRGTYFLEGGLAVMLGFAVALIGMLFYIYLPISASTHPPLNWDNPTSIESFLHMLFRKNYPPSTFHIDHFFDLEIGQAYLYLRELCDEFLGISVSGVLSVAGVHPSINWKSLSNIPVAGQLVFLAFYTSLGMVLGVLGMIRLFMKKRQEAVFLIITFIFMSFIFVGLFDIVRDKVVLHVIHRMYIISFLIFGIFVAAGYEFVLDRAGVKARKYLIVGLLVFLAIITVGPNSRNPNKSQNWLLYDFCGNMIRYEPHGSIMVVSGDTLSMGLDYYQMVDKRRPNIYVIDQEKLTYPWYCDQLRYRMKDVNVPFPLYDGVNYPIRQFLEANPGRRMYFSGPRDPSMDKDYKLLASGLLRIAFDMKQDVKVEDLKAENDRAWARYVLRRAEPKFYDPNSFESELVTIYAKARFNQGWTYDLYAGQMLNEDMRSGRSISAATKKLFGYSEKEYLDAIKMDPGFSSPYKNLGIIYANIYREKKKTIDIWKKYLLYNPNDSEVERIKGEMQMLEKMPD